MKKENKKQESKKNFKEIKPVNKEEKKEVVEIKKEVSVKKEKKTINVFKNIMSVLKKYSLYITLVSTIITIILLIIVLIDKPKINLLYSFLGPQIKELKEQQNLSTKYNEIVSSFKNITAEEIVKKYNDDKLTLVYYGRS